MPYSFPPSFSALARTTFSNRGNGDSFPLLLQVRAWKSRRGLSPLIDLDCGRPITSIFRTFFTVLLMYWSLFPLPPPPPPLLNCFLRSKMINHGRSHELDRLRRGAPLLFYSLYLLILWRLRHLTFLGILYVVLTPRRRGG